MTHSYSCVKICLSVFQSHSEAPLPIHCNATEYFIFSLGGPPIQNAPQQAPISGANTVIYLDRQLVACPGSQLLMSFRLINTSPGQASYIYNCSEDLSDNNSCLATTSNNAHIYSTQPSGNTNFLDRLAIDCGTSGGLNSFQMKNLGNYWARYDIRCCKPSSTTYMDCADHYTNFDAAGSWTVPFLDRHRLLCPADTVMNYFRLQTNGPTMRYHYRCCHVVNS